jgi:hypothetical protein
MRLLNTKTLELSRLFVPHEVPDYVILSHRWSTEEVTFLDISKAPISEPESETRLKAGFAKIQGACELAESHGYEWIWIDRQAIPSFLRYNLLSNIYQSCCIDKSSSAELQEAINSMWRYYEESNICYVYMADIPNQEAGWDDTFCKSEWFQRGWTLQELISPVRIEFYTADWQVIGTKFERHKLLAEITSIRPDVLVRTVSIDKISAAERLSWAAHRKVTRAEDEAYSLLGLFSANMPLLYGEGRENAFLRLQKIIYNSTGDHSIFLYRHSLYQQAQPLLADLPKRFCERSNCVPCLARQHRCLPLKARYSDIIPSHYGYRGNAHEQIMTTVSKRSNQMSTMLPLLEYKEVSDQLEYPYGSQLSDRGESTHVVVLKITLKGYPSGALCLIVRKDRDSDSCIRFQCPPVLLPIFRPVSTVLQRTRLLICAGRAFPDAWRTIDTEISVQSGKCCAKGWRVKNVKWYKMLETEPAQPHQSFVFKVRLTACDGTDRQTVVECDIANSQNATPIFTIHLWGKNDNVWLIKEISQRLDDITQTLIFSESQPLSLSDRCRFRLPGGEKFSIELRRLPGTARAQQDDEIPLYRYQISISDW